MNAATLERRFRKFLLFVVEFMCLGTIAELYLAKHVKEPVQFVPFALCILGFLATLAVQIRPRRNTIWGLRVVMLVTMLGSLLGIYLHLASNLDFQVEMRPGAPFISSLLASLMGAAPLLAPGMLAVGAILALAATYYHPALGKRTDVPLLQAVPETAIPAAPDRLTYSPRSEKSL